MLDWCRQVGLGWHQKIISIELRFLPEAKVFSVNVCDSLFSFQERIHVVAFSKKTSRAFFIYHSDLYLPVEWRALSSLLVDIKWSTQIFVGITRKQMFSVPKRVFYDGYPFYDITLDFLSSLFLIWLRIKRTSKDYRLHTSTVQE